MRHGLRRVLLMSPILIGFALLACSCAHRTVPLPNVTAVPLEVGVYENGRPAKSVSLAPRSAAAATVESILQKPSDAWHANVVDYAPGILVRGDSFTFNFQPHRIVLDAADDRGQPSQWVCKLTEAEYAELKHAVNDLPTSR